jgi:hypothetical protein
MKKILITLLLVIGLVVSSYATDWYSYIGKQVKVCTIADCYIGKVDTILEIEICKQREPITNNCIIREYYYTMLLRQIDDSLKIIRCEAINDIEEIK